MLPEITGWAKVMMVVPVVVVVIRTKPEVLVPLVKVLMVLHQLVGAPVYMEEEGAPVELRRI
jgi:hypothetical protein